MADTASEVADEVLRFLIEQRYESGLVAFCEIHDVDVVAYSSAVMGGPVAAKDLQLIAASDGDL